MDPRERETLLQKKEEFAREVAASERTSDIIYELQQSGVISEATAKYLLTLETTKTARVRMLVDELVTCGPGSFTRLLEILLQFDLGSLVAQLNPDFYNQALPQLSGVSEELDLRRTPYQPCLTLPSPAQPLPSLPRPPNVTPAPQPPAGDDVENNNPARPLKIKVIPYTQIGGAHHPTNEVYRNQTMPRGLVFLANYHTFCNNEHPPREGSELDVKHLVMLFSQMGYQITTPRLNMTKYETIVALREFCAMEDLAVVDSVVVVIMSHGRDHASFYTSDNLFLSVNDVVERFSNRECPSLKGKPKIFIFQYCRGSGPDVGVAPIPQSVSNRSRRSIQTDAANYGEAIVHRDPTFTDMYIVYSTVEGFVSFRHPERGSWLMEAICCVFMQHACTHDLDSLMKMVSRRLRENCTDDGNKQVCEFVQRAFDRHFYFNPEPLADMGSLNLSSLSRVLDEEGARCPPQVCLSPKFRQRVRARSRSREARRRNLSGASGGSREGSMEDLLSGMHSEAAIVHPRIRSLIPVSQRRISLPSSSNLHTNYQATWNRSFSESEENISAQSTRQTQDYRLTPLNPPESPASPDECYDIVDHVPRDHNENISLGGYPSVNNTPGDPNANRGYFNNNSNTLTNSQLSLHVGGLSPKSASSESVFGSGESKSPVSSEEGAGLTGEHLSRSTRSYPGLGSFTGPENGIADEHARSSFKRQLSVPSTRETQEKINDVKRFLQVHDSDPKLIGSLQRIESFVNKKKYEGKRRKVEDGGRKSSSQEY